MFCDKRENPSSIHATVQKFIERLETDWLFSEEEEEEFLVPTQLLAYAAQRLTYEGVGSQKTSLPKPYYLNFILEEI